MADVLAVPIHQLDQPRHANTVGTALLGFERLGLIGVDDVLRIPKVNAVFEPDPAHTHRYDELSERFEQAFKSTRPLFRNLNKPDGVKPPDGVRPRPAGDRTTPPDRSRIGSDPGRPPM